MQALVPVVHAVILTLNEERHIARCIESIVDACASITVIDSGSTDATVSIAQRLGANVLRNTWRNYSTQMNFAIDALSGREGWLLRIDADEIIDSDSTQTLLQAASGVDADVDGVLVRRRIHFMGRRIRYGGIEPSWQLRLWRNGRGRCEQRWMDEHIKVDGPVSTSGLVISDINMNSISWWTSKHNSYASREAIDVLLQKYKAGPVGMADRDIGNRQAHLRRMAKELVYNRMSGGIRACTYFIYRYLFRLGFLDGKAGWYFHVLQGFWYRTLVDAKIFEIDAFAKQNKVTIIESIHACTGIEVNNIS